MEEQIACVSQQSSAGEEVRQGSQGLLIGSEQTWDQTTDLISQIQIPSIDVSRAGIPMLVKGKILETN